MTGIQVPPRRDRSTLPHVDPAGGDPEHAAHGGDRMVGLVAFHEFESRDGIDVVSLANQAAAFLRNSSMSGRVGDQRETHLLSTAAEVIEHPLSIALFI